MTLTEQQITLITLQKPVSYMINTVKQTVYLVRVKYEIEIKYEKKNSIKNELIIFLQRQLSFVKYV